MSDILSEYESWRETKLTSIVDTSIDAFRRERDAAYDAERIVQALKYLTSYVCEDESDDALVQDLVAILTNPQPFPELTAKDIET